MTTFEQKLKNINILPHLYLSKAKKNALENGYNPKLLSFSNRTKYKLNYDNIYFGDSNYGDYNLYSLLAKKKLITQEQANKRRELYLKRATNIKGEWKDNKLSKNLLAQKILW